MADNNARQAVIKIFKKNGIALQEAIYDFFMQVDLKGEYIKPLLIGMTNTTLIIIRRKKRYCGVSIIYFLIPLDIVLVSFSCSHRRQLTIQAKNDQPIHAVFADCERSPKELAEKWQMWTDKNFYVDRPEGRKKSRILNGSYKVRKSDDPFEFCCFETRSYFLVDPNFFLFWLRNEVKDKTDRPKVTATSTKDGKRSETTDTVSSSHEIVPNITVYKTGSGGPKVSRKKKH